ncbi:MAG: carboxypeptidase regulatory-like domain-containing protein [Myxococcales bacterium]|nr:carboxypeptidase regulatory-like domain-containing protein [Myxococcota bacterium]MDW8283605.1 carboxypeptidase regulatory-like domain-containing protein [Myxococcales bacterium]
MRSIFLQAALWALLLLPSRVAAVGEVNARLRGSVVEAATRAPVPGAKVEIRSPDLVGGVQSQITDEMGRFDFLSLPPGRYTITVSFEGIKPIRRTVTLLLGQTLEVDIPFVAEMTQVETTIIDERVRLDPNKTSTGMILTAQQQEKLATPRTYQGIVQQAPGVTGGSNPVMAGGSFRHNRYLVDGLDITDPVTNTFSANFNFDNIAQVEALTVPMDARYNALGGVINLVTMRGSDKLVIDSSLYINHEALSAGSRAGPRLYHGRLLDQSDPRPPNAAYQANINVGGPIIKQRLWFYASIQYSYTLRSVVPGPPLNVQHAPRVFHGVFPRLKLTWAPAPKHRLEWSVSADPAFITNLRQSNAYTDDAEFNQNQGGFFTTLNYDYTITSNLLFSVQTGYIFQNLRVFPANGDLINSSHSDRASLIVWNAADAFRNQDDQRHRFQFDPMVTWIKKGWAGIHTFTGGIQFAYLRHYQMFSTPGNMQYTDDTNQPADGGVLVRDPNSTSLPYGCNPLQPNPIEGLAATPCFRITYREPIQALIRSGWSLGGFIQDIWQPTRWLSIVPGFRIDYGMFGNSLGQTVQNVLGFGPRLGLSFRLTPDNKTLLKLNYGRANEVSTLLFAASADTGAFFSQWNWNRATGRFDRFFTSGGGADGYDLRGRCADGTLALECGNSALNLNPPRTDSVTATLEREFPLNVIAGVSYTFRYHQYLWEDIELNSFRVLDGGDYAGYIDKRFGEIYAYRPVPEAFRRYNGVDFYIRKFPDSSSGWTAFVAYTLSFLEGTVDDQISALYDDLPRNFRFRGFLSDDHRHQVKAQATYTWRGLSVGGTFFFNTGAPTTRLYLTPLGFVGRFGWRGVDPGNDPNDIKKWTELRSPDFLDINIRAQYDLYALIRAHVTLIVDLFNAFDLAAPVSPAQQAGFENRNSPLYGTVTNRQLPFRAQLAIRYQY